ncbi:MAG: multicopper oxidase domain-containing protein, partial [Bacteroidetes bacterium]|nr:multicopper oxidase domain-containing protein [Bacteroidota bacterium]
MTKPLCVWVRVGVLILLGGFAVLPVLGQPEAALSCEGRWRFPDPHCLELVPKPELRRASGIVRMERVPTPFGVAVTVEGHHRYNLTFTLAGLPDPASLGPYTAYVAWVTTPRLLPMVKLGAVRNGRVPLGEVHFNRFMVLVTAEADASVEERTGKLVLRGRSPSDLMEAHDLMTLAPLAVMPANPDADDHTAHAHPGDGWTMPPMHPAISMPPGMMVLKPQGTPFLPDPDDAEAIPEARPRQLIRLADGDTLDLDAGLVRRTIRGRRFVMYGFNGQVPGPLLHVPQEATVVVNFTNHTEWPTAVHWHGVRLDNRFDGVPGVTQDPVEPGGSFQYRVFFRDAGLYWYHPHHREDVQQDLGLYGNMLVRSPDLAYFSPVNREEVLMLDDLLIGEEGLVPYGATSANYMLMGRFGNVFLLNGEPDYTLA